MKSFGQKSIFRTYQSMGQKFCASLIPKILISVQTSLYFIFFTIRSSIQHIMHIMHHAYHYRENQLSHLAAFFFDVSLNFLCKCGWIKMVKSTNFWTSKKRWYILLLYKNYAIKKASLHTLYRHNFRGQSKFDYVLR